MLPNTIHPYSIAQQSRIGDAAIFLLDAAENAGNISTALIPREQLEDIALYQKQQDRDNRLLARSFLFMLLRERYGMRTFSFGFGPYRKPFLEQLPALHFSFSYANDKVLVALSEHKAIGADIEFMDPRLDMESMAPEIMCAAELEYFRSLVPAEERRQYFFRLFSAKEALIKAFGTGLYYDVKQIDTTAQRRFARNNTFFSWHDRSFYEKQYSMALCLEE